MRILKLFKKHILALLAAIVLIVISCNADLALPTYMSDIVDVGVQQGGIASPVPDTIRAESLDDLELFMSTKDAKSVEAVFSKATITAFERTRAPRRSAPTAARLPTS